MVRSWPRASAGLSRLAASPVPAAPPAPTSVCVSSMNRMMGLGLACTSSMTERRRCSNSPFMLAPACSRPTSSVSSETSFRLGGTSPRAMRCAKPSTTAVLPTPASPTRIGLFWRRRIRMSTTWRISSSRPTIGSILPLARLRGEVDGELLERLLLAHLRRRDRAAGLAGRGAAADVGAVAGGQRVFGRAGDDLGEVVEQVVRLDLAELGRDRVQRVAQRLRLDGAHHQQAGAHGALAVLQRAVEPASCTIFSMTGEKSEIDVAPRGSASSAVVMSLARREASSA